MFDFDEKLTQSVTQKTMQYVMCQNPALEVGSDSIITSRHGGR